MADPTKINHDEQTDKQGIYGIKIVKPGSVTYFYFSEGLEAQNLDALSRKVYRQFIEAAVIQEYISRNKKLQRRSQDRKSADQDYLLDSDKAHTYSSITSSQE